MSHDILKQVVVPLSGLTVEKFHDSYKTIVVNVVSDQLSSSHETNTYKIKCNENRSQVYTRVYRDFNRLNNIFRMAMR